MRKIWRMLRSRKVCAAAMALMSAMDAKSATQSAAAVDQAVRVLDAMEVTGSRLARSHREGPLPATVITRQQIERSGAISVALLLRHLTYNSFGAFTPTSGTGAAQGGAQIDLRGLGAARTLVLIDGRRLPNSPGFNGAAQNLNVIPLAMVERIEILREGASAVYGSDAIGGVVNIVTRDTAGGFQLSGQFDRPDDAGGDADAIVFTGGLASGPARLNFAVDWYDKDLIYSRDRAIVRDVTSAIGSPGTVYQYDAQGFIVPQRSNPDDEGRPRNYRPFDDCPTGGYGSDNRYPLSARVDGICRYRVGAVTALTADLNRRSLTLGGDLLLGDGVAGFARLLLIDARSFGRFPAAPVDTVVEGVNSPDANGNRGVRLDADNPFNPIPGSTLVLNYRTTVLGPRDDTVRDQVQQSLAGLRGMLHESGWRDWEIAAGVGEYRQQGVGENYGLARELQAAVDDGRFNPFMPDARVADTFRYTTSQDSRFRTTSLDARLRHELQVGELTLRSVVGAEYRDDKLSARSDAQSAQTVLFDTDGAVSGFRPSNVFGSAGGSASGGRSYRAAYLESTAALFDTRFEVNLALRNDRYSDVGARWSPRLAIGWRPHDALLLRTSLGAGFRAPDLTAMYGAPSSARVRVIDRRACRASPDDESACGTAERIAILDGNPTLRPETSRHLTIGSVWNPDAAWSLEVDYFAIGIDQAITQLSPQSAFDNELRCIDAGRRCEARSEGYIVRSAASGLLFAYSPAINAARLDVEGIDLDTAYRFSAGPAGRYDLSLGLTRMLSYRTQDAQDAPRLERLDTLSPGGAIYPRFRLRANLTWTRAPFDATLGLNHISDVSDCDAPDRVAGSAVCANTFDDYRTVDLQIGADSPWGQRLALGVRNLFDEAPSVSRYVGSLGIPGVFYALHDSDQRVFYLRLTQQF